MKNLMFLVIILVILVSVSCKKENKNSLSSTNKNEAVDSIKIHSLQADPDSKWKESEPLLKETFIDAPIGKYPCPFKTIPWSTQKRSGTFDYELPCNCATYNGDNKAYIVIVEDTISPYSGTYIPESNIIVMNRYRLRKTYKDITKATSNINMNSVTYLRWINALLQQEIWHSKGNNDEFQSDIISIKIAGELFIYDALVKLIENRSGGISPSDSYDLLFNKYESYFIKSGLNPRDLKCDSKTSFGERAMMILKKHPNILTEVKMDILKEYSK